MHIVRGTQVLFSLIIIGLAGDLIHGYYFNQMGFAIFCVCRPFSGYLRQVDLLPPGAADLAGGRVPFRDRVHRVCCKDTTSVYCSRPRCPDGSLLAIIYGS